MKYEGKTLIELIELSTEEQQKEQSKNEILKESVELKQKGFHSVEIDNDNGMCMYDYLYNDM